MILKKNNLFYLLIFVLIVGFFLRYINNYNQMYWLDEAYTLFLSDPSIPFSELSKKIYDIDDNPSLYFYILRYFNYLSYTPENIRLSSIIFSVFSLVISIQFYRNFLNKEESFYAFLLLTFNIFLIWQSKEARISNSVLFFSLLNFNIFFLYLKNNSKFYSFMLLSANIFLISYYPFLITILITQFFYIILSFKKKYFDYFLITLTTLILYFFLNYDYLISNLSKTDHIGVFEYKFFINYFFRTFFGSIFFGGISLLIFVYSFLKIFFKEKKNDLIFFNILLIIVTYSFIIFYSYFKAGIMVPRYFIFLIPSIILVIVKIVYNYRLLRYFFLALTILNTLILFDDFKIKKPKVSYLLNNIDTNFTNNFFVNEGHLMDKYFIKSNLILKNLNYIKKNNLNNVDKFYYICLNHPEMHVGNNKNIQEIEKCNKNFYEFNKNFVIDIKDFKIILFEKKTQN